VVRCATLRLAALAAVLVGPTSLAAIAQTRPGDIGGHWAEERIADLASRGVVAIAADGAFRPGDAVSRGQFVAWLMAARGLPPARAEPFADVPLTHEHAAVLESAAAYGVIPSGGAFRPNQPLARGDAVVFLVRALGYTFETAYMTNASLTFRDVGGLAAAVRGAVAVAALTSPPLLREPAGDRFRPADPMTRAEAASLIWSYLQAIEGGVALTFTVSLAPGVTLVLEKRGALRALPVWRVQVGAFPEEDRARRLAETMRARGLVTVVDPIDDLYKVRVGNFTTREEAAALQQRLAGEGFATWPILTVHDYEALGGPFWTGALLLEPAAGVRLRPAPARDDGQGRARTSDAARRTGALAAVNGGFFSGAGDPLGCLVIDGEVHSEPIAGRSCAGLTDDGQVLFDVMRLDAAASTARGAVPIDGVNRARGANEVVLFRPTFGPATRTNAFGAEVVVVGDTVHGVADGRGGAAVPPDGYVLSGHGRGRAALLGAFRPGDRVALRVRLAPASDDPRWDQARHVIGGGPRLLAGGLYVGGEGFRAPFSERRHPRTAIGRLADGRIVLVTVGGRQPYHSLGMTLVELATYLRQLGVTDALNLDGGGSTTLVVRGTVVNLPSDESGERPVSDVLVVFAPGTGGP
jgi:hypothetical protein